MRKLTVFICTGLISSLPQDPTAIVNFSTKGGAATSFVGVDTAAAATGGGMGQRAARRSHEMRAMRSNIDGKQITAWGPSSRRVSMIRPPIVSSCIFTSIRGGAAVARRSGRSAVEELRPPEEADGEEAVEHGNFLPDDCLSERKPLKLPLPLSKGDHAVKGFFEVMSCLGREGSAQMLDDRAAAVK